MKCTIGTSENTDVSAAVREAVSEMKDPILLIFITDYTTLKETSKELHELFPKAECIGTSGTTYVKGQVMVDKLVVVGFLDGIEAQCGVIKNLSKCPVMDIKIVEDQIKNIDPGPEDTVCIEFCTNSEEQLVTTLGAAFYDRPIGLMGGTVCRYPKNITPQVCYNGELYEDACAYAFVKNLSGKVKVYKENIYGLDEKRKYAHLATKVDITQKELTELDHRPAAEVYCEETGITRKNIVDNVFYNPLGRIVGDDVFIFCMSEVKSNGAIVNHKRIYKNDTIYILKPLDYKKIIQETGQQIQNEFKQISLLFCVNCSNRDYFFQKEDYLDSYVSYMSSLGPYMCMVAGGEQFNNQHVNESMICVVFE